MIDYPIPTAALDDRLAFVGASGSGKTYAASGAVEHVMDHGGQVIVIDPLGVWFGLRILPDGHSQSPYDAVIFGGDHGDLPISEHAAATIGDAVAGMAQSCIVDLSQLGTKAAERRFMLGFLTSLYRRSGGGLVHLVIDEADMFAPQRLLDRDGDAAKLLGMMETIVRRGRVKGFIPWLISQRPAVLSKDVLSQVDGMVALKLPAPQDRDAIGAWIEGQADRNVGREILASLPSKQRGHGVVWIPARGVLEQATFPAKRTYDSSRAPRRGETSMAAHLAPLDIAALRLTLATIEADRRANDPTALKDEIARLKALRGNPAEIDVARAEGFADGYRDGQAAGFAEALAAAAGAIAGLGNRHDSGAAVLPPNPHPAVETQAKTSVNRLADAGLSPSARRIVDVIHKSYPVALTFDAAARRAGVSRRSSAYRSYRAQVIACSEIEAHGERLRSVASYAVGGGIDTRATVDEWVSRVTPSVGAMLIALHREGPLTKSAIATAANISHTSSGLGSGLRELVDLGLIERNGDTYRMSEGLQP